MGREEKQKEGKRTGLRNGHWASQHSGRELVHNGCRETPQHDERGPPLQTPTLFMTFWLGDNYFFFGTAISGAASQGVGSGGRHSNQSIWRWMAASFPTRRRQERAGEAARALLSIYTGVSSHLGKRFRRNLAAGC
jgi:hypothetical protein